MNYDEIIELAGGLPPNQSGIYPLKIKSGKFENFIFQLGKVWFEDDDKLSFELDILQGKLESEQDGQELNQFVGDYIVHLLMERLKEENEQRQNENTPEGDQS